MADHSNIAWTKSTFNPWIGCTKVGPGCDGCYAEALDARMQFGGGKHWGAGVPRYRTSASNWAKPLVWNRAAPESEFAGRKGFWPVFCASLADVFDNEVPQIWRSDLFFLIEATPNLSWLLVTKRIGNVEKMVPLHWLSGFPAHVRLLITVTDQPEADRDLPRLLALPCKNGISYEPALDYVDWTPWIAKRYHDADGPKRGVEWIIPGGESDQPHHKARPFDVKWARSTVAQCKAAGVPVFVKQLGSNAVSHSTSPHDRRLHSLILRDRAGADPSEWPEDLRVREFPLAPAKAWCPRCEALVPTIDDGETCARCRLVL